MKARGILLVNHFLQKKSYDTLMAMFQESARKNGVDLTVFSTVTVLERIEDPVFYQEYDFVISYNKDIRLLQLLESNGLKCYNSALAVDNCHDKRLTYLLTKDSLRVPKTLCVPVNVFSIDWSETPFLEIAEGFFDNTYPFIAKVAAGSFGTGIQLVHNKEELLAFLNSNKEPALLQEYIRSSPSRDLRIQVVGNQAILGILREAPGDGYITNVSAGGKATAYTPSDGQAEMAIKAARLTGCDFAGVDIFIENDGEPILCEVNSNSFFHNHVDFTGVNTSDRIIEHIVSDLHRTRS